MAEGLSAARIDEIAHEVIWSLTASREGSGWVYSPCMRTLCSPDGRVASVRRAFVLPARLIPEMAAAARAVVHADPGLGLRLAFVALDMHVSHAELPLGRRREAAEDVLARVAGLAAPAIAALAGKPALTIRQASWA